MYFRPFFSKLKIVFLYNKLLYAKREAEKFRLVANKKGRRNANGSKIHRNVHSSKFNVKRFVILYKYVASKVSCLVSVSARSSLDLVSKFFSKSQSRLGLETSMSCLGLEDFGRDSQLWC